MNDEKEVGNQSGESAASETVEPSGKLPAEAQSGGEAQDKSNALEIETFIDDRDRELPRDSRIAHVGGNNIRINANSA
ncbi:MAG: hypothetical protein IH899_04235 [Planctomycetes bacterium]|nr:hypothetical protein [Planctomycetota bacterium]